MLARWLILGVAAQLAGCAQRVPPDPSWYEPEPAPHPLAGYRAAFALSWQGARIGGAVEELVPRPAGAAGFELRRREEIVVRRGGAPVAYATTITITTDPSLRAEAVQVRRRAGSITLSGTAARRPDGSWWVLFGDEPGRRVAGDAVPAELVPLLVALRPDRRFRGRVVMAGYGFSVARVQVAPTDRQRPPRHAVAVVDTAAGRLRSEIDLAADGTLARVRGGDAVSATRVDPGELAAAFDPPELVDQSAIPVSGPPTPEPIALELAVQRPSPPPALPGQRVAVRGDHWRVELLPGDQGDSLIPLADPDPVDPRVAAIAAEVVRAAGAQGQRAEVVALTLATAQLLDDDLASPAIEPTTALSLGRGDCTTHAVLFAALARARGITARLVTGYRLDGRRLVRHRWAVAAVDGAWIAVDPAHGEAPAAARLLGLAIHGAAASELAVVDELAFADMGAARARFVR